MAVPDRYELRCAAELRAVVGEPHPRVISKETPALGERAAAFIAASPFVVIATGDRDGASDASPKGGPPGFVKVVDARHLLVPEFPGNRRLDGVHNLVGRPGVGLLFVVPGISETLRVNGVGRLTRDPGLCERCAVEGRSPWFVIEVEVRQVFSHCGKAFLRSGLWNPASWTDPAEIVSPSLTIAERALAEGRSEASVRRDVEDGYRPELY
jgi:PPOX class probable FMN-dependent enzyme